MTYVGYSGRVDVMNEYLVSEHQSDLRREAAAHNRFASRADRAPRRTAKAHKPVLLHRRATAIGCEA